jgi:hypothetical protein
MEKEDEYDTVYGWYYKRYRDDGSEKRPPNEIDTHNPYSDPSHTQNPGASRTATSQATPPRMSTGRVDSTPVCSSVTA